MTETERRLRDQLEEAQETIRQLKERLRDITRPTEWTDYRGLSLTRVERLLLTSLYRASHPLSRMQLRHVVGAATGRIELVGNGAVQVPMYRLRGKLRAVRPPITISTSHGFGYVIDDANKTLLTERLIEPMPPKLTA